ncbi:MAG: hypothetical protein ACOX2P_08385 [Bacillota bacterium]|jgi:hypothetical protein
MNNITIQKSTIKLTLLLLLFKVFLDLAYLYVVSPVYAHSGFTISIQPLAVLESYILVFVIGIVLPPTLKKASHFFLWMFAVSSLIPSLSFYAMHSGSRAFTYAMFFCFLCVLFVSKLPVIKMGTLREGLTIGISLCIIMVFVVLLSMITKGGFSFFNLDLTKVYEFRRNAGALINTGIWGYLNTWAFKVINPAMIGWALWQKKYRLVIAFIALQVVFFGISSHKSVLFYPVLVLIVYFFYKQKHPLKYLTLGLIAVVIVSAGFYFVFNNIWPASLFIRRVFFVPAHLNFVYHDLFSEIGHVYLSNSVFSSWIPYPFDYPPTLMVSYYMHGHYNTWANNGFLASGYMHFGYFGMFLFSIITGLFLWITDILITSRMPLWLGITIIIAPFHSLFTSSDLFTSMLTHGIIVALVLLLVIGKKNHSSNNVETIGEIHGTTMSSNLSSSAN